MGNDTFVKTTHTGWGSRIKSALGGLIVGPILIIMGIWLLVWNEGHSAKVQEALHEGEKEVVAVSADSIDPGRQGKLIYVTGTASTPEILTDQLFGVSANALRLRRNAEMYQWKEDEETSTTKEAGGGETKTTTYSYSRVWSSTLINSSSFQRPEGHTNPSSLRVGIETLFARDAKLGAYHLDELILLKMAGDQRIVIGSDHKNPSISGAQVHDGGFYIGKNPNEPAIGDTRVSFEAVMSPQVISVVGAQAGAGIGVYVARNGYDYVLVGMGAQTAAALFQSELNSQALLTWILRFAGFIVLFIGFAATMGILGVLGDVVPFIGNIIRVGTGLIAFLLGLATWTITVAIAWFAYRPVHAVILLVVALGIGTLFYRRKAQKVTEAAAVQAAA